MNTKSLLLYGVSITLLTAGFIWWFGTTGEAIEATTYEQKSVAIAESARVDHYGVNRSSPAAASDKPSLSSGNDLEATDVEVLKDIQTRFGVDYDPMITPVGVKADFTESEIAAYNKLHVLPYETIEYQEQCIKGQDPEFPELNTHDCELTRITPVHPYGEVPLDELTELAHGDPIAALFMAQRTTDPKAQLEWALRASAISGKPGPVFALAERKYSAVTVWRMENGQQTEKPQFDSLVVRIALEKIAETMGDPRANVGRWKSALSGVSGAQQMDLLKFADEFAAKHLSQMASIEQEVTGTNVIAEKIDS